MVDPTEMELAAMHAALAPLGDYVASIGMERPLAEYRREEVLRLIEVVVDAYQAHMIEEHERLAANEGARVLRDEAEQSTRLVRRAAVMLDFNHQPRLHERLAQVIDQALANEHAQQTPRQYLGASRLGVSCERALQFEYAGAPVDPGREFSGRTLRIFEVGHVLEDLAIRWLRLAGFDLYTRRKDGGQFGFSVAGGRIQGHVDGIFSDGPADLDLSFPMLFECKTMADKHWKETVKKGVAITKPVYAAQIALYQAYMEPVVPGISANPALFTAINKDTQELWFELVPFDGGLAQRMSDRAVRVIQATEAGELLPRGFADPSHFECKFCSWAGRCWRST